MNLRLKRTPGIYLVGFMGSGKTTVGRLLAGELGWRFVDIDHEIESREGVSISEIFDTRGEPQVREIEATAIRVCVGEIERGEPTVVALGGGAFAQSGNQRLISANGISIWLDCPLEVLRERVAQESNRPLARDPEKFAQLYENRRESYRKADFRIDATGEGPQPVLRDILRLPIF
jgi:shikimate kinase